MSVTAKLKQLTEGETANIQTESGVQQQAKVAEAYQPEHNTMQLLVGTPGTPLDVYIENGAAEIRDLIGKSEAEAFNQDPDDAEYHHGSWHISYSDKIVRLTTDG